MRWWQRAARGILGPGQRRHPGGGESLAPVTAGVVCGDCGASVAPGRFCSACGTTLKKRAAAGAFCTGCGEALAPDASCCGPCGQKTPASGPPARGPGAPGVAGLLRGHPDDPRCDGPGRPDRSVLPEVLSARDSLNFPAGGSTPKFGGQGACDRRVLEAEAVLDGALGHHASAAQQLAGEFTQAQANGEGGHG